MRAIIKFLDAHLEEYIGAILLAGMAVIAVINVFVRYCTNWSFSASEELTVNGFVWVVLLGTALAFRDGSNFGMNVLFNALPRAARSILMVVGTIACIAFFIALGYEGAVEVADEIALDVSSESLAIPVWIYTGAIPLCSALIIIRIIQRMIRELRQNQHELDLEESK